MTGNASTRAVGTEAAGRSEPKSPTPMGGASVSEVLAGRERPMLFSAPMVRALLSGRKTQTRRVVKGEALRWLDDAGFTPGFTSDPDNNLCPHGKPGDGLWVKETWRPTASLQPWDLDVRYNADGEVRTIKDGEFGDRDWTMPKAAATGNVSPLFMPRWASRLTLEITDVRVERLHDISEADAETEGVREPTIGPLHMVSADRCGEIDRATTSPLFLWEMLWRSINGANSWDANPWVWVVTFAARQASNPTAEGV